MGIFEAFVLFTAAVIATEFVFAYHWKTRGTWKDSHFGVHMMVFMLAIAVVLDVTAIEDLVEDIIGLTEMPQWWEWLETLVFLSIPIVLLWRRIILGQVQRENGTEEKEVKDE